MSVTIGATTGLSDPSNKGAEYQLDEIAEVLEMADGSGRKHVLGTRRVWHYTWERHTTEGLAIKTAIEALIAAGSGTFKPWDTSTTYTVEVVSGSYRVSTKPLANEMIYTIRATFREL
mgnify:FL=1